MDQHTNKFPIALKCECLDYDIENSRNHYGRFAVYPLSSGQAITVGTAVRRALLGEIESTCITSAYVVGANHEYSTLSGVRESVHDILLNLKDIVLKSTTNDTQKGVIAFQGPGVVRSEHIQLPSSVEVVDKAQYIARLETDTQLEIHLTIEKSRAWHSRRTMPVKSSTFPVANALKPVRNINYSIHSFGEEQVFYELLILEVWTNGSLTPHEALHNASCSLALLFQPFLSLRDCKQNTNLSKEDHSSHPSKVVNQKNHRNDIAILRETSIDQLQIPVRASNCLKKAEIYTVLQLLDYTQEDLLKIKNLGKKSAEQILRALQQRFGYTLPLTRDLS